MELVLLIALGIVLGVVLLAFLPFILQLAVVVAVIAIIATVLTVSSASLQYILSETSTSTLAAIAAISAFALALYLLKQSMWRYTVQVKKGHDWIDEAEYLSFRSADDALKRRLTDLAIVYSDGEPISSALGISGIRLVRRSRWLDSDKKASTLLAETLMPPTVSSLMISKRPPRHSER